LRVATQAKIRIAFDEHFPIDRTVRVVADGAAFAQRLVFKNERPRLGLMTLRATLILRRHRESARRFENVAAVRIVAVGAIHVAFDDRMMLRQIEFRMNVEVTLKTGFGIFAGIDDEPRRAAGADVFAAGTVAGFAAALAGHRSVGKM
jgi:hypothetical protein